MEKNNKDSRLASRRKDTRIRSEQHPEEYRIRKKHQTMMAYMDSGWKEFTSIRDKLAREMNRCLEETDIPEWMTKGKTTLTQKEQPKGTALNNHRPITCLSMI